VDVRFRRVSVLGDRALAEAKRQGLDDNDIVIVKTIITKEHPLPVYKITKVEGSPTEFLLRMLDGEIKI